MQAMAWWSVPLAAFVLAIVWVSLANRPRPPADPHDSVAEHQRFREAMGRSVGTAGPLDPPAPPAPGADDPEAPGATGPRGSRA
jgi:hypothetical protein